MYLVTLVDPIPIEAFTLQVCSSHPSILCVPSSNLHLGFGMKSTKWERIFVDVMPSQFRFSGGWFSILL